MRQVAVVHLRKIAHRQARNVNRDRPALGSARRQYRSRSRPGRRPAACGRSRTWCAPGPSSIRSSTRGIDLARRWSDHVRGRQAQSPLLRCQHDVGQDRDRVAAFDDGLDVRQGLQEGGPFDGQFHCRIDCPGGWWRRPGGVPVRFAAAPRRSAPTIRRGARPATGNRAKRSETIPCRGRLDSAFGSVFRRLAASFRIRQRHGAAAKGAPVAAPLSLRPTRAVLALKELFQQLDVLADRAVSRLQLLDLAHGVHHRGVVAVAELAADLRQLHWVRILARYIAT